MDISATMDLLILRDLGHAWTNKQVLKLQKQSPELTNNPHQPEWLSTRRRPWTMAWGRRWEWVLVEGVRVEGLNLWGLPGCPLKARPQPHSRLTPHYSTPLPLSPQPSGGNGGQKSQKSPVVRYTKTSCLWVGEVEVGKPVEGQDPHLRSPSQCLSPSLQPTLLHPPLHHSPAPPRHPPHPPQAPQPHHQLHPHAPPPHHLHLQIHLAAPETERPRRRMRRIWMS